MTGNFLDKAIIPTSAVAVAAVMAYLYRICKVTGTVVNHHHHHAPASSRSEESKEQFIKRMSNTPKKDIKRLLIPHMKPVSDRMTRIEMANAILYFTAPHELTEIETQAVLYMMRSKGWGGQRTAS